MEDCNRAIEINPEHALFYLIRGSLLRELGDVSAMLIDFDNAVRLCSNYETDFLDRDLISDHNVVGVAIQALLDVVEDPDTPECDKAYYTGVHSLYVNPFGVREAFENARNLGFSDRERLDRHLQNLPRPQSFQRLATLKQARLGIPPVTLAVLADATDLNASAHQCAAVLTERSSNLSAYDLTKRGSKSRCSL